MRAKKSPTDREPQASGLSTTKRAPLGHILILLWFFFACFSRRVTVSFSNSFLSFRCSLSLFLHWRLLHASTHVFYMLCAPLYCKLVYAMHCIVLYQLVCRAVPCRAVLFVKQSLYSRWCLILSCNLFYVSCKVTIQSVVVVSHRSHGEHI